MSDFDVVIIGAGVCGLACGYALGRQGMSVAVLEAEKIVASITSARNSEVIHAGFYYQTDSLKHRLCCHGRRMLYQFADDMRIAHKKCGKLVVATTKQEQETIEALAEQAQANGVEHVQLMTQARLRQLEPQINAVGGLFSGETGIVDVHGLCQALSLRIEQMGGVIALNTKFSRAEACPGGFKVQIVSAEGANEGHAGISTRILVNSAGLNATWAARRIEGLESRFCRQLAYAKGSYFSLSGKAPFSRLVYPAPVDGGLGVHATLDMAGRVRFGPDVEWLEQVNDEYPVFDYRVDGARARGFYDAIRRYWSELAEGTLTPDYAGIRPKLSQRGQAGADFAIDDVSHHGVAGLVNLFGLESPGLTASLAIGEEVAKRIMKER